MDIGAAFSLILLSILLSYGFYRRLIRHHQFFNERGIAFIKPTIFFGNMLESFLELESHESILKRFCNKFRREKLFGIFMFLRPIVVVRDVELITQLIHSGKFLNRARCSVDDILSKSLFHLEDARWMHTKNAIAPFFNESTMKEFYPNISLCADDFIRLVDKRCASNSSSESAEELVIDTREIFEEFSSNVISIVVLGKGFVYGARSEVYEIAKKIESDLTSVRGGLKLFLMNHFPLVANFLNLKTFRGEIYDFLKEHVTEEIESRWRRKVDNRHDFVQFLLKSKSKFPDDATMTAQVLSFFVSGFSVLSKLFQACCYELSRNDKIQNELYDEMKDEEDFFNKYKKFKYLNKFVLETLRKWPPVAYLNRICTQNCTIELANSEKYRFFSSDFIKIPLRLIHNDPEIFDDPNYFNPHRFNDDDDGGGGNLNLIYPFGLGARACLCSEIAIFQVKLALFKIIRKYAIMECRKTPDEHKFSSDSNTVAVNVAIKLRTE